MRAKEHPLQYPGSIWINCKFLSYGTSRPLLVTWRPHSHRKDLAFEIRFSSTDKFRLNCPPLEFTKVSILSGRQPGLRRQWDLLSRFTSSRSNFRVSGVHLESVGRSNLGGVASLFHQLMQLLFKLFSACRQPLQVEQFRSLCSLQTAARWV